MDSDILFLLIILFWVILFNLIIYLCVIIYFKIKLKKGFTENKHNYISKKITTGRILTDK